MSVVSDLKKQILLQFRNKNTFLSIQKHVILLINDLNWQDSASKQQSAKTFKQDNL
jgi:hypothetical protein